MVASLMWVLGVEPRFSARAIVLLTTEPTLQPRLYTFYLTDSKPPKIGEALWSLWAEASSPALPLSPEPSQSLLQALSRELGRV